MLTLLSGYFLIVNLTDTHWGVLNYLVVDKRTRSSFSIDSLGWKCVSSGQIFALSSLKDRIQLFTVPRMFFCELDEEASALEYITPKTLENRFYTDTCEITLEAKLIYQMAFLPCLQEVSNHLIFVVCYMTPKRELKISLFEWWSTSPLNTISVAGTVKLPIFNSEIPKFIIPLYAKNGAFLIMSDTKVVLMNLNDAVSGNFDLYHAILCDQPISYFQEESQHSINSNIQYVYYGSTSNRIHQIAINVEKPDINITCFASTPISIGTSLILTPCDSDGTRSNESLNEADYFMLHTGGGGVIGGSTIIGLDDSDSGSTSAIQLNPFQFHGPVHDALMLNASQSFVRSDFTESDKELFIISGSSKESWAFSNIRYGIKAECSLINMRLPLGSKIFTTYNHNSSFQEPYFLVVSSVAGTSVYQFIDSGNEIKVLNVSESCGFQLNSKTIACGSIEGYNVQICPDGIYIFGFDTKICEKTSVSKASICKDYIVVSHTAEDGNGKVYLSLYQFVSKSLDNELKLISQHILDGAYPNITVLKLIQLSFTEPIPAIFIGEHTLEQEYLRILEFDSENSKFIGNVSYSANIAKIRDLIMVNNHLLLGLNDGSYISGTFGNDKNFNPIKRFQLGKFTPLEFHQDGDDIFIFTDMIYKVSSTNLSNQNHPELLVTNDKYLESVRGFCFYPSSSIDCNCFLVIFGGRLMILDIFKTNISSIIPRSVSLTGPPKKAVYLPYIKLVVIIYQGAIGDTVKTPCFQFLDPRLGKIAKFKSNTFDSWLFSKDSKSGNYLGKPEKITCCTEWTLNIFPNTYKYFVLGSSYDTKGVVYILKVSKEVENHDEIFVELTRVFSISLHSPVHSVAQFSNDVLVVSTDYEIHFYQLELQDSGASKYRFKLLNSLRISDSPVIDIQVFGQSISILTQNNSVKVLYFSSPTSLLNIQSDIRERPTCHQTRLDATTLAISDKNGNVSILSQNFDGSFEEISEIELPEIIVKIIPIPTRENSELSYIRKQIKGGNSLAMIAVGINGSIYILHLLDNELYKALENKIYQQLSIPSERRETETLKGLDELCWREQYHMFNVIEGDILFKQNLNNCFINSLIDKSIINI